MSKVPMSCVNKTNQSFKLIVLEKILPLAKTMLSTSSVEGVNPHKHGCFGLDLEASNTSKRL